MIIGKLTDIVCMGGSLHSGIRALFPEKYVEGLYMYSPKTMPATLGPDVRSFLNESFGIEPYRVHFEYENMLLLFEALFSGPFESARDLELDNQRVFVRLEKKKPGDVARCRGLSGDSLVFLNQVAFRGLHHAAMMMHRRNLLNRRETKADILTRFYRFISSSPSPLWRDIWLSIPWHDGGAFMLAEQNPVELILGGIAAGKI